MAIASAEQVLALYRERINEHDFDRLRPLISPDAVFWFGDGSHVGIDAVRVAFEKTWAQLADETYRLDDLVWIARGGVAVCLYSFHWRASEAGQPVAGQGPGTSILARSAAGWQIVHEHLSANPPPV